MSIILTHVTLFTQLLIYEMVYVSGEPISGEAVVGVFVTIISVVGMLPPIISILCPSELFVELLSITYPEIDTLLITVSHEFTFGLIVPVRIIVPDACSLRVPIFQTSVLPLTVSGAGDAET